MISSPEASSLLSGVLAVIHDGCLLADKIVPLEASNVQQLGHLGQQTIALDDNGNLFIEWISEPILTDVRTIASNAHMTLIVLKSGAVLVTGNDKENRTGILGIQNLFSSSNPAKIPGLKVIRQISLGSHHAAAVDVNGKLFTWGTDVMGELGQETVGIMRQRPIQVKTANIYNIVQVACGENFTFFCTAGGLAYVFGSIGSHGNLPQQRRIGLYGKPTSQNVAYSLPGLENVYIEKIAATTVLVAALTDTGVVLVCDSCLNVIRLPANNKIDTITTDDSAVYGQTSGKLYKWVPPVSGRNVARMQEHIAKQGGKWPLQSWTAEVYSLQTGVNLMAEWQDLALTVENVENKILGHLETILPPRDAESYVAELLNDTNTSAVTLPQAISMCLVRQQQSSLEGALAAPIRRIYYSVFSMLTKYAAGSKIYEQMLNYTLVSAIFSKIWCRHNTSMLKNAISCMKSRRKGTVMIAPSSRIPGITYYNTESYRITGQLLAHVINKHLIRSKTTGLNTILRGLPKVWVKKSKYDSDFAKENWDDCAEFPSESLPRKPPRSASKPLKTSCGNIPIPKRPPFKGSGIPSTPTEKRNPRILAMMYHKEMLKKTKISKQRQKKGSIALKSILQRSLCSRLVTGLCRINKFSNSKSAKPVPALYSLAIDWMVFMLSKIKKNRERFGWEALKLC